MVAEYARVVISRVRTCARETQRRAVPDIAAAARTNARVGQLCRCAGLAAGLDRDRVARLCGEQAGCERAHLLPAQARNVVGGDGETSALKLDGCSAVAQFEEFSPPPAKRQGLGA